LVRAELSRANAPIVVAAQVELDKPHKDFFHGDALMTSRTQLEIKIGGCGCVSHGKSDIVLLKSTGAVKLTCHRHGPADVVAAIDANDVDVAVEIKACPSSMREQRLKCCNDVKKMYRLVKAHPNIRAFFLLLDKSVSIPEFATVRSKKHRDCLEDIGGQVHQRCLAGRPSVEVWDIDAETLMPRRRYYG
jgi:hypothetical protein